MGFFKVKVYDEEFLINRKSGVGFEKVISKMEPTFTKILKKRFISGYTYSDMKHELVILAIEGINNFNPDKNVKLSTFLETHINNKLISKIKTENKMARNATYLKKTDSFSSEIPFTNIIIDKETYEQPSVEESVSEEDTFLSSRTSNGDYEFNSLLDALGGVVDEKIIKAMRLIMFSGMNIKEASNEVGLNPWVVSRCLRSLSKNPIIRDFYDR